jgi:hypothetical protein
MHLTAQIFHGKGSCSRRLNQHEPQIILLIILTLARPESAPWSLLRQGGPDTPLAKIFAAIRFRTELKGIPARVPH